MATFVHLSQDVKPFFDILPDDWAIEIEPIWEAYADHSEVYVLTETSQVVGGGILFSAPAPDVKETQQITQQWFDKGYKYIAYFYIAESRRGEGLGQEWLHKLMKAHPDQPLFLTIEEYSLVQFYEKSHFKVVQEIDTKFGTEWLMVREVGQM